MTFCTQLCNKYLLIIQLMADIMKITGAMRGKRYIPLLKTHHDCESIFTPGGESYSYLNIIIMQSVWMKHNFPRAFYPIKYSILNPEQKFSSLRGELYAKWSTQQVQSEDKPYSRNCEELDYSTCWWWRVEVSKEDRIC